MATQAVQKMTEYAFINFNIVRIVTGVFDFNKSSMKVLEKNGYYLESIRKNAVIKNGEIIDDYIWVKLRDKKQLLTLYKKHRAFVLNPKMVLLFEVAKYKI